MPARSRGEEQDLIAQHLREQLEPIITRFGVPKDETQAMELAAELLPVIEQHRGYAYKSTMGQLGADMARAGLEISVSPQREYGMYPVTQAVLRAAGIGPKASKVVLSLLDADTQKMVRESVPAYAFPNDPKVQSRFLSMLQATAVRHALDAGRKGLLDTLQKGTVRDAGTKQTYRGRIGYARVLSGSENCAFCSMLASRGPVYRKDTVLTTDDGSLYHDSCDCRAVPVIEGQDWEGREEYERLEAEWRAVTWDDGKPGKNQWERWQAHVNAKTKAMGKADLPKGFTLFDLSKGISPADAIVSRHEAGTVVLRNMSMADSQDYMFQRYAPNGRLTREERNAVTEYTGPRYQDINTAERKFLGEKPWNRELRDALDSAMRKVPPIEERVQVVRRLDARELAGSVITDGFELVDTESWVDQDYKNWGYLSTSTVAQEYFGDVELRLTLPPGTRGIYVGDDRNNANGVSQVRQESEYLLNRQTRYRIVDVVEEYGTTVAYAEVIGQDVT